MIIHKKQNWDYKKTTLLSDYLNVYKLNRPNEFLILPKQFKKVEITTKELIIATTMDEYIELIEKWAYEVYQSWIENHLLVSQIANGFIENILIRKTRNL